MALYEIPCTPGGQPEWTQRTQLNGTEYLFNFRWNQRDGHWFLRIADGDGVALYDGLPLVTGLELLAQESGVRAIEGGLFVVDDAVAGGIGDLDPGFADLGTRFKLLHVSAT